MSRWVLKMVGPEPPVYMIDYRKVEPDDTDIWHPDIAKAETFQSALEAITMARRVSYLLLLPVETVAMSSPEGSSDDLERARYDARDRLCAALMTADLDDEGDYDEVERELARAFLTSPGVIRGMKRQEGEKT